MAISILIALAASEPGAASYQTGPELARPQRPHRKRRVFAVRIRVVRRPQADIDNARVPGPHSAPCQPNQPRNQRPQSRKEIRPRRGVAARPLQKGDHVFLVDGSGYIFRAYHALPPLTRKSDGLQVNAVLGFCNMLWKLLRDMKPEERPTHLAVVFDKSEKTFRTRFLSRIQGQPRRAAGRSHSAISADPRRRARLRHSLPRTGRLRGRRPDRDLCAARLRGEGDDDHRVLRQGPDAARRSDRGHVRHHEGQADRPRRGDREIRRAARESDRGAVADRRFQRQRAGRAGHRREDRRATDRRIRRSRNAAQARRRDQAGQAPPDA